MPYGTRILRFEVGDKTYTFPSLSEWSDNFGDMVPRTNRLLGASGGFDEYGDLPAPAEIGNVRVTFTLYSRSITGMTALVDAVRALARWGKGKLYYQPADESKGVRWTWVRVNNVQLNHNINNHGDIRKSVSINFQASDPHWYTAGRTEANWGGTTWGGGTRWGSGVTTYTAIGASTDIVLPVEGNAPVRPRIEIAVPVGKSAENVTVRIVEDGAITHELVYTGTLNAGDELNINTWDYTVTLNGANAFTSAFTYTRADWMSIAPPSVTVQVAMANPTDEIDITLYYFEAWV